MGWKLNDPAILAAIANGLIKPSELEPIEAPGPSASEWSEKEFMARVVEVAKENGWLCYHTYDSRKSQAGYPDLTMVKDRLIFMELKVKPNVPTAMQEVWLERLKDAGQWAFLFYPEDFPAIVELLQA